jgi:pimeloyl-ACP methyl ester carboxylesterase
LISFDELHRLADHPMSNQNITLSTGTQTLEDGRTLAYTSGGAADGFPVIVHHGTPGSRLFAAMLSDVAIEQGIRLITPDRPGYGRSSPPPTDWTWHDWQTDLTELLQAEAIDRAALLGFSGGGPFALAAATSEWASRVGVVSTVIPPADTTLTRLSKLPFILRVLFRVSSVLASVAGPEMVVKQYTDRPVSEPVSEAIAEDFHEGIQQDAKAIARENRLFASDSIQTQQLSVSVRAWHGTQDENAPLSPVQAFMTDVEGTLVSSETDHLGTLLEHQRDVFRWLSTD